ncbi:MAG: hypothetical protein ACFFE2_01580 [Candidatus Thorarchaeota archaeon]
MAEDERVKIPEKCVNCGSNEIAGPFEMHGHAVYIELFSFVRRYTYVCVDCMYVMYFVNWKERESVRKKYQDKQLKVQ